ncbi:thiol reductant ABC exporter subunit CydC [Marinobacter halodurans]|uniref:Thiol reductant ABC exporter subunit CydC n=1 Tax=Marinobacter halodurans TaxID=2528979 RepID=A0ABY1ZHU5_9GAMM|nr:thiol reductant ABC exporter subunit CydC [Marinobacter halodurans]TBW47847.1 thiol reductant ABC exporter subunit CydC [Marinobacter halodurans]
MNELWPWLKLILQRRGRLVIGGVLILLTVLSAIGLLGLSGWFLTASAITGALLAKGIHAFLDIYVPGGGIRFFAITRTVSRYVERVFNHDTVLRLLADLRVRLFSTLAHQLPHEHLFARASDRLSRLVQDIDALDNLYLRLLAPLGVAILAIGTVSLLALLVSGQLALWVLVALLALAAVITLGLARMNRQRTARRVERLENLRGRLIETLEGQAELRAAGLIGAYYDRLLDDDEVMMRPQYATERSVSTAQGLITWTVQAIALLALVMGLGGVESGTVSGPVAVLIPLAVLGLGEILIALPPAYAEFGGTVASARRLNNEVHYELMDAPETVDEPSPGELEWLDVGFAFEDHHPLLSHFSLKLAPGDRVGFIGASGSGKSTLADLAAGLLTPDTGEIRCHGRPRWPAGGIGAQRNVAYLTQRTHLFNGTLLDNLKLARPDVTSGEIWHVLEVVQLAEAVDSWPLGLMTWVGEAGRQLSGGEARRVALARVLLLDAPIVILDEPFTGLDRETAAQLSKALEIELSGKTVVGLAHDASALPPMHRTLTVEEWRA